jgi:hypothetical protein
MSSFPLFIIKGSAKVITSFTSCLVMDLAAALLDCPFGLKSQLGTSGFAWTYSVK